MVELNQAGKYGPNYLDFSNETSTTISLIFSRPMALISKLQLTVAFLIRQVHLMISQNSRINSQGPSLARASRRQALSLSQFATILKITLEGLSPLLRL